MPSPDGGAPPAADTTMLTENWYDTYPDFNSHTANWVDNPDRPNNNQNQSQSDSFAIGRLTASITHHLSSDSISPLYSLEVMKYDIKGRVVEKNKSNPYLGDEKWYFCYNFAGEVTETEHFQFPKNNFKGYYEKIVTLLDHRGRILETKHQWNNENPIVVAEYEYDGLGKLKQKTMFPDKANMVVYQS